MLSVVSTGRGAGRKIEHFEILDAGVEDAQPRAVQQAGQWREIERERIDEDDLVIPPQLDQGNLRKVGAFAMELGVDRVPICGQRSIDYLFEL